MAGSSYQSGTGSKIVHCPKCGGSGTLTHRNGPITCDLCHGQGDVSEKTARKYTASQPLGIIPTATQFVKCPECGGSKEVSDPATGRLIDCPTCGATGEVTEAEKKRWLEAQANGS